MDITIKNRFIPGCSNGETGLFKIKKTNLIQMSNNKKTGLCVKKKTGLFYGCNNKENQVITLV